MVENLLEDGFYPKEEEEEEDGDLVREVFPVTDSLDEEVFSRVSILELNDSNRFEISPPSGDRPKGPSGEEEENTCYLYQHMI
jgi:hypothetical protein